MNRKLIKQELEIFAKPYSPIFDTFELSVMKGKIQNIIDKVLNDFSEQLKNNISNAKIKANESYEKPYKIVEVCLNEINKLIQDDTQNNTIAESNRTDLSDRSSKVGEQVGSVENHISSKTSSKSDKVAGSEDSGAFDIWYCKKCNKSFEKSIKYQPPIQCKFCGTRKIVYRGQVAR